MKKYKDEIIELIICALCGLLLGQMFIQGFILEFM